MMAYGPPMGATYGPIPSYKVKDFHVFFGDRYLPNADWIGFEDLGHGYGKNNKQVFYMGELIPHADAFSFKIVDNGYAKDKHSAFHYGLPLDQTSSSSSSFFPRYPSQMRMQTNYPMPTRYPMQQMYSMPPINPMMQMPYTGTMMPPRAPQPAYMVKDFHVFFNDQYLPHANWINFTDLGQGYGKDETHVFYMGQIIDGAHPFTFEVLNKGYSKDKHHVYQYGQVVEGLHPFSFQGL